MANSSWNMSALSLISLVALSIVAGVSATLDPIVIKVNITSPLTFFAVPMAL
jgi:hypothetical protein